ncbi:MAG: hypothetical protein JWM41_4297 [Gemmatimonadetes bacterium]|nr:hypothetical protein [Gemmatimonadota bacterium]
MIMFSGTSRIMPDVSLRRSLIATAAFAAAAACSSKESLVTSPPPPSPSFTISSAYGISASTAAVRDPQPRVRYAVTVTNGSATDEQIAYGGCWASIRLFPTPARSGTPSYDSGLGGSGCTSSEMRLTLPSGQSIDLVGYIDVAAIVASGLAGGHYFVSILVSPNGSATPIAAGEIDIQP